MSDFAAFPSPSPLITNHTKLAAALLFLYLLKKEFKWNTNAPIENLTNFAA